MKLSNLFLSSLLLSVPLFADRVMITKTAKKENLKQIQYKLKKVNTKMYVKKTDYGYLIYSKDYASLLETKKSLKKIKLYFPTAYVTNTSKMHTAKKETQKKEIPKQKKTPYFVNLSYGMSSIIVDSTGNPSQSNSGNTFGVDGGYYFDDSFYCSLAYLSTSSDSITTSTLYGSVDYKYDIMKDTDIYAGVLLGYSSLDLKEIDSSSSTSFAFGVEAGVSYEITPNIPLSLTYQNLLFDHTINLAGGAKLSANALHNFKLSVGYKF